MQNNFVFSQDPLLYQSTFSRASMDGENLKQQMEDAYIRYRNAQEQYSNNITKAENSGSDKVKELNELLMNLTPEVAEKLNNDAEYGQLNLSFQKLIQTELLNTIKWRINENPKADKNMTRQIEIIKELQRESEAEERRNLNELNDYMKNYSNMTFDEYKRIKNGGPEVNNNEPNKRGKK